MSRKNEIKVRIFGEKTTMLNDYQKPPGEYVRRFSIHKPTTDLRDDVQMQVQKKKSSVCNESLTKLRENVHIPFNLLWKPDPITRRKLERPIVVKPVDCGKEESIRTRPRICLQPAVSIDDVESKEKRDLLLNYMYTTEFRNAERDLNTFRALSQLAKHDTIIIMADFNAKMGKEESINSVAGKYTIHNKTNNNGMRLCRLAIENGLVINKKENTACCCGDIERREKKSYECMINNPKCRITTEESTNINVGSDMRKKYYKAWDDRQKRASVDPTVYFWQHTDIPKNIHVEDGLITEEMKEQINELVQMDKLRNPHDLTMTGYTAHKVQLAKGVPMRRKYFPVSHPMLTVQQAFNTHYEEDMDELKNKQNSN